MSEEKRGRGDRWFLITVLALFFIGVGIRSYGYFSATNSQVHGPEQQKSSRNYTPRGFAEKPRDSQAYAPPLEESRETNFLIDLAPYLTEGGLSFFLGFCIGYFLRLVTKTLIIIIGGAYCCLILLSHYGIVSVDWGSFQHILQQVLLNTQVHVESLQETLKFSLPTAAMGGLGIWRGLKKP